MRPNRRRGRGIGKPSGYAGVQYYLAPGHIEVFGQTASSVPSFPP